MKERERNLTYWFIQIPGWFLLVYIIFAQGISAFDYELGVRMGTQEPATNITEVGTAFWYGFALGDLLTYIPLLCAGLVGHMRAKRWGTAILSASMGITVYWPVVCLVALVDARDATGWSIADETPYWIVLPLIAAWGAWGLWAMVKELQSGKGELLTPPPHTT